MAKKGKHGEPWSRESSDGRNYVLTIWTKLGPLILVAHSIQGLLAGEYAIECVNKMDGRELGRLDELVAAAAEMRCCFNDDGELCSVSREAMKERVAELDKALAEFEESFNGC